MPNPALTDGWVTLLSHRTASKLNEPQAARIYDAIEEDSAWPTKTKGPNMSVAQTDSSLGRAIPGADKLYSSISSSNDPSDDVMSSFVPMLQEYLSCKSSGEYQSRARPQLTHPIPLDSVHDNLGPSAASVAATDSTPAAVESDDDDFVYDLYYKSEHPQPNPAVGTLTPGGNYDDISSLAGLQRIGELAGLDEDEILNDELSSEEEDEADQDSNGKRSTNGRVGVWGLWGRVLIQVCYFRGGRLPERLPLG